MNSTLRKTQLSFNDNILNIKFLENTIIEVEDVIYVYCYAAEKAKGKPYGVVFDTYSKHELTEEAILYFANSSQIHNVIAMAYISKDLISKIRLSLLKIFEKPVIEIKSFSEERSAREWVEKKISVIELSANAKLF